MRLPAFLLLLLLAAAAAAADEGTDSSSLPDPEEFHRIVREVMEGYPTDGSHAYWWPKGSKWAGNTRDLHYAGELFSAGDPQGRSYCCGLTFEVFFRSWEAWSRGHAVEFRIGDLDAAGLRAFRGRWFCSGDYRRGPVDALVEAGLGTRIETQADARRGDFIQLWRKNGSGHSVIFLRWETDGHGRRTGIRYWSTQPATDGIGARTESFEGERGVVPEEIFIARAGGTE
ncbi:MAG: hypothetical protein HY720_00670 [Planctomycetes bacterium]|nr:hypothetical protein [Planctomycetota bacterium]